MINELKHQRLNTKPSGFTLIEVLISAALLVILASGFIGLQYIMSQNQVTAWKSYLSIEAANTAISSFSKEARDMRPSETGAYPLQTAGDKEIIFYSDIDHDGTIERVRYTLSGNTFQKGVIKPISNPVSYPPASEKVKVLTDIVRNGTNPVFYYYNLDWPTDTTNNPIPQADRISDTRLIKIKLMTNPKANDSENDYILETDLKLRMLN